MKKSRGFKKNNDTDNQIESTDKLKLMEEEFENLRIELAKEVSYDVRLSNQLHILKISKKLDQLHNEYIKNKEC